MNKTRTFFRALPVLALFLLCFAFPARAQEDDALPDDETLAYDPLEGFNRAMFAAHEGLDRVLLKPAARGYETITPLPARIGIDNFFGNLTEIGRGGNALLQGKPDKGLAALGRLLINSTVGIFGLFDVASEMGLEDGGEDFGQTLAVWGVPNGPFLFVPLLGPFNARDLAGWSLDQATAPLWAQVDDQEALRNTLVALNGVRARANLLPLDQTIEEASFDKYTYLRSAYLQRRAAQIRE